MCGITGFYHPVSDRTIVEMTNMLSHRGPDEQIVNRPNSFHVGVTRLSINDITHGSMPIYNENNRFLVVQNGEIYNSPQLRERLKQKGHIFRTGSDTEVIVHGYEEYGENIVEHLQGIFAFAVYDIAHRKLFLARDRLGVKPLFYTFNGKQLIFGSEVKSILRSKNIKPSINSQMLIERYVFGHPLSFSSIIEGINQLPPGHILSYDGHSKPKLHQYFTLQYPDNSLSIDEAVDSMVQHLHETIYKQLLSDVPVGVMLSGGIDSCALAFLVNKMTNEPLHTFTIAGSYDHPDITYSRIMARLLRSSHNELIINPRQGIVDLPRYIWALEDFDYNHMMLYLLGKFMRGSIKCVLSGHGADELFLGYRMYDSPYSYGARIERNLMKVYGMLSMELFQEYERIAKNLQSDRGLDNMIKFNQQFELPNDNLNLVDRLNMAHGIEVRVPYLDEDMVSFANALPIHFKLRQGENKIVFRLAMQKLGLPPEICSRPKVMAGRNTVPETMRVIEEYANSIIPDSYVQTHPFAQLLDYDDLMLSFEGHENGHPSRLKSYILAFDLLTNIFIDNNGTEPKEMNIQDMY